MKRLTLYITVGLLSFLCFVAAFAPASPFWTFVEDDVNRALPELEVYTISGTIWSGKAQLRYQGFPVSRLHWQLDPLSLIRGSAALNFSIQGEAHDLTGHGNLSSDGGDIGGLSGNLHSQYVNTVSEKYGLTFSGELNIDHLMMKADRHWFTDAGGVFHWTGGRIIYRTYSGTQVFALPPLDGRLYLAEDRLRLDVSHQQQPVLDIVLQPSGWALVNLKARLFQLADQPWPGPEGQTPDRNVLQVEEKIFPGRNAGS